MAEELIIPPIQQSLEDLGSAQSNGKDLPLTEKSWYLYWQRTGRLVNQHSQLIARLITYGPHADRPDPGIMPAGALYMETDRSDVIYQNIDGNWQYLTGTMWGTLNPDQRPTDLGPNDGGFHFRGSDVAREFLWSQTVWVEVTAVRYGTHAARPAIASVADGVIYVESDRGNVIYQARAGVWQYVDGTMWGTLNPDQRPTGLGTADSGFLFQSTDTHEQSRWSGTAWVNVTQSAQAKWVKSTAVMTLTTASQDVPGASVTLDRLGSYLLNGVFDFLLQGSGDAGALFLGQMNIAGATLSALAVYTSFNANSRACVSQQWIYTNTAVGTVAKLQAYKNAGSGTSVTTDHCTLVANWVSQ